MATDAVIVRCPAKVNLSLRVLGRRPDGYHEIESVVQALDLYDQLTIHPRPTGHGVSVSVEAEYVIQSPAKPGEESRPRDRCAPQTGDADVPTDHRNLCWQAAQALIERTGEPLAARIAITKRIPPRAGLGGGSSDAAGALAGLNELFGLGLDGDSLVEVAASIGSDVPFFLTGGAALIRGRGERVAPLECPGLPPVSPTGSLLPPPTPAATLHFALALPRNCHSERSEESRSRSRFFAPLRGALNDKDAGGALPFISTADAYARLGAPSLPTPAGDLAPETQRMVAAVEGGDLDAVAAALHNDFERVILADFPPILRLRDDLLAAGCRAALLAGSGAAVFGLAESREQAQGIAAQCRLPGGWSTAAEPSVIPSIAKQSQGSPSP